MFGLGLGWVQSFRSHAYSTKINGNFAKPGHGPEKRIRGGFFTGSGLM